jgi:hypothetical protein
MEAVLERENLKKALAQVKRNRGASGAEGMTVCDLPAYLKEHWLTIRGQLLEGTCKPQPVRRVEIPKASGGLRPRLPRRRTSQGFAGPVPRHEAAPGETPGGTRGRRRQLSRQMS